MHYLHSCGARRACYTGGVIDTLAVPGEPPWLTIARRELGVHETPGAQSTPRINEYLATCGAVPSDEIAWCSAFVNWCMDRAGLPHTGRLAARSWLKWGDQLASARLGAVTVLWRESPQSPKGHVGLYLREAQGQVFLLGGNQANQVCVRAYTKARVLGYRWPTTEDLAHAGIVGA